MSDTPYLSADTGAGVDAQTQRIKDACRAEERYGLDELEAYAESLRKTESAQPR